MCAREVSAAAFAAEVPFCRSAGKPAVSGGSAGFAPAADVFSLSGQHAALQGSAGRFKGVLGGVTLCWGGFGSVELHSISSGRKEKGEKKHVGCSAFPPNTLHPLNSEMCFWTWNVTVYTQRFAFWNAVYKHACQLMH